MAKNSLPSDLKILIVDAATPAKLVAEVAELSIACGVMPVPGPAMRGQVRDGICLVAVDAAETVVATASSYLCNHPESARAKDAFWDMLATSETRRGERIGKILGAETIVRMGEAFGVRSVNTGVTADNASSMALCASLGVPPSEWTFIGCIDPAAFGRASMTR